MPRNEKLQDAIKLSFPVIGLNTFEKARAEEICQGLAKSLKKDFYVMKFKEIPVQTILENALGKKELEEGNGAVIFDPFFFDRKKINHETLPALQNSIIWFENMGINYIVAGDDYLKEEYVYNVKLSDMSEDEIMDLLKLCESNIHQGDHFDNKERKVLVNYAKGLSHMQMKNVFTMCSYLKYKKMPYLDEVKKEKGHLLRDYGLEILESTPIEEVGGLDNIKSFLEVRKAGFDANLPIKGMLLVGLSGGGKTLAAKATADVLGTSLLRLDMGRFYSKYIGETEAKFRKALSVIEQVSPVTVLLDEMEKYFGNSEGDHEVSQRLLATFLFWLQERKEKIFIVATANRVQSLPTELMRSGRWDKSFCIDLPNEEERETILAIHCTKNNIELNYEDIPALLNETATYTGAEIEQAIIESLFMANFHKKPVDYNILSNSIKEISPVFVTKKEDIELMRNLRNKGFSPASSTSIEDDSERKAQEKDAPSGRKVTIK